MSLRAQLRGRLIDLAVASPFAARVRETAARAQRLGRPGPIELFWQADDPQSHLLAQVLPRLAGEARLPCRVTVVPRPGPAVDPEPDLRVAWGLRDAPELARRHGLSFPAGAKAPSPDLAARAAAILAVGDRGFVEGLSMTVRVGQALWSGDGEQLDALAEEAGSAGRPEALARHLAEGAARLTSLGHYMGGAIHFDGGWFRGIDRVDHLEDRLRRDGRPVRALDLDEDGVDPLVVDSDRTIEVFFSFRSPYSYLALPQVADLARTHRLQVALRPVLPMVMRGYRVPLAKRLYLVRDAAREARRLGIPFGRIADPLGVGIERAMAAFFAIDAPDRRQDLVASVMTGVWAEARDIAVDADLRTCVERADIGWDEVADAVAGDPGEALTAAEENRRVLQTELGLWGVPSFRVAGTVLWGQDRIPLLDARLQAATGPA